MVGVTKTVTFDCAHMLDGHLGLCANLHGHTYRVEFSVYQDRLGSNDMVVDFSTLKKAIDSIISKWDHACIINTQSHDSFEIELLLLLKKHGKKVVFVDGRATAENMAFWFKQEMESISNWKVTVTVYETPTSCAEVL